MGWHRIPLRTARKVAAVDYRTIDQPSACAERGGQIEYIAPVRGDDLTTRGELLGSEADHPRAREECCKLQLGAFEKLKEPVKSGKWKRLTFLYTTGEHLLKARSLNGGVVDGDERQLYTTDLPQADFPSEVLIALLGIRAVQGSYDAMEQSDGDSD